jgi:hypothetical protein
MKLFTFQKRKERKKSNIVVGDVVSTTHYQNGGRIMKTEYNKKA